MTKGRKPLPTKLKLLRGNPGKRKPNANEPQPDVEAPECPEHLSAEAREEWKRVSAELLKLGVLARIDRAALAAYCQCWARWVDAELKVDELGTVIKSPNGFPIQNPYLSIANKALAQLKQFVSEFGLSPASRTRVKGKEKPQANPLEEFLKRGKGSA